MNIKTLISGIILLIAICLGIYFWTEWQKARFDAELPTPPPETADEKLAATGTVTNGTPMMHTPMRLN